MIIDTHTHMYPGAADILELGGVPFELPKFKTGSKLKKALNSRQNKFSSYLQLASPLIRNLPEGLRPMADMLHGAASVGSSIGNSGKKELLASMDENGIELSLVIAHPPMIPNEFILRACENEPRLRPVVNIPENAPEPKRLLKSYVKRGAVALKIHAAADGLQSAALHYHSLLETAQELDIPVIIHTGCIHIKPVYKDPEMGHAQNFKSWFLKYPKLKFILAHMNYHYPLKAIEYCERYENVFCDCSWQPSEIIQEALLRIPEKIMFGSDWPLVGANQETIAKRVGEVHIDEESMEKLKFLNAKNLFKV